MAETVFASWTIDKTQHRFWTGLILTLALATFLLISVFLYFVLETSNIFLVSLPAVLFIILIFLTPEAAKSWSSVNESEQLYITDQGIYLRELTVSNKYKFIKWENIASYDVKYFISTTFFGKLFSKPSKFFLKGRYEEDSFSFLAFGDDVDIARAYLKEKNIPFGFVQK